MLYMFVLVHVLLEPPSRVEGFGVVNSLLVGNTTHLILQWIKTADALQYVLSCLNGECEMKTVKGSRKSASHDVFSMEDVTITLTAFYPCSRNTTQRLHVTLTGTVLPSGSTSAESTAGTTQSSSAVTTQSSSAGTTLSSSAGTTQSSSAGTTQSSSAGTTQSSSTGNYNLLVDYLPPILLVFCLTN